MKNALLIAVLAFGAGLNAQAVKWMGFNEGTAAARAAKKAAVVDFYTDWCGWCKTMDAKTYGDDKVRKLLADRFIAIKVNPETCREAIQYDGKTLKAQELLSGLGITGFPATAFMDKEGKFITVVPGYIEKDNFLMILKYVDDECYRMKVPFDEYQKNPGACKAAKKKGKTAPAVK
jgi:thioredoxin-related protein